MSSIKDQKIVAEALLKKFGANPSSLINADYLSLVEWVSLLDYHYHTLDKPLVSDVDFDHFFIFFLDREERNPS